MNISKKLDSMTNIDRSICTAIHDKRESYGLNRAYMAKKLNMSLKTYIELEIGIIKVNTSKLFNIAHAIGCTVSEILIDSKINRHGLN